jgi:hypothetical protein
VIAFKFLGAGAVAPYTQFPWPVGGEWVSAPAGRADVWIHACRRGDLSYWIDEEIWRIELEAPLVETRYQIASARGRLRCRLASSLGGGLGAFEAERAWQAHWLAERLGL